MSDEPRAVLQCDQLVWLANDLLPYAGKLVGSIRIDVQEVSKIVAALDELARHREQAAATAASPSDGEIYSLASFGGDREARAAFIADFLATLSKPPE